jgi:molecular chaperone GrpE
MADEEIRDTDSPEEGVAEETAAEEVSVEELQRQLEAAQQKADDNWNQVLRIQADLENLRKRSLRDVENAHKFALEKFAVDLLPVRDSLEMGLSHADDEAGIDSLREGMELTLKALTQALEKYNIVEVNPVGERFDPELHEAMAMQESDEAEPNTVLTVVQKGYTLNGRLIRPAMVVVARASA